MPLTSFFIINIYFFFETTLYAIFVACVSLIFYFSCGIVSGSWVRCERLGVVKVKVPVLSVVVVVNDIQGTQKVVPLLETYGSVTDQVDP